MILHLSTLLERLPEIAVVCMFIAMLLMTRSGR